MKSGRSYPLACLLGLICPVQMECHAAGILANADFSQGLDGWSFNGGVLPAAGRALLWDNGVSRSTLNQGALLEPGPYELAFDFLNLLSPNVPANFLPDAGFVSVFFTLTPGAFDPVTFTGFDSTLDVLDVVAAGIDLHGGTAGPSANGTNWLHFTTSFIVPAETHGFVVFDFFNLNGIDNDSSWLLDDVSLVLIPEPNPGLVSLVVLAVAAMTRRKRSG